MIPSPSVAQVYTFLETCVDTVALLPRFIRFFQDAKIHSTSPGNLAVVFLAFGNPQPSPIPFLPRQSPAQWIYFPRCPPPAVLNLAFALSLLCFLIMHASLLLSNTTTIEVTTPAVRPDPSIFGMLSPPTSTRDSGDLRTGLREEEAPPVEVRSREEEELRAGAPPLPPERHASLIPAE